jgi:hypothetical protein
VKLPKEIKKILTCKCGGTLKIIDNDLWCDKYYSFDRKLTDLKNKGKISEEEAEKRCDEECKKHIISDGDVDMRRYKNLDKLLYNVNESIAIYILGIYDCLKLLKKKEVK